MTGSWRIKRFILTDSYWQRCHRCIWWILFPFLRIVFCGFCWQQKNQNIIFLGAFVGPSPRPRAVAPHKHPGNPSLTSSFVFLFPLHLKLQEPKSEPNEASPPHTVHPRAKVRFWPSSSTEELKSRPFLCILNNKKRLREGGKAKFFPPSSCLCVCRQQGAPLRGFAQLYLLLDDLRRVVDERVDQTGHCARRKHS